jgi:hypothetical protein
LVEIKVDVTYYSLNPQTGIRFYTHKPRPTTELVESLKSGADVYLDMDY